MMRKFVSIALGVVAVSTVATKMVPSTYVEEKKRVLFNTIAPATVATKHAFFPLVTVAHNSSTNWNQIRKEVEDLVKEKNCGPLLVRLSWHAAGTYSKYDQTGGSGATMRYAPESKHGANAGLGIARDYMDAIHKRHPEVSYSDLWAFAANVAIETMGGPRIRFRPGRKDHNDPLKCTPDGRLPDATKNSNHIRDIFNRMGFNDQEITALIGAHTLGHCHPDRSGFSGPWTRDPYGFSNQFFVELLENRWEVKPGSKPEQYQDATTKELMMLPSDMAFLHDPEFRKWVEIYARDSALFNQHFAAAFQKLQEIGVPAGQLSFFPIN